MQNSIGEAGIGALAAALLENDALQKLNLSYNSVGDGGAAAVALALGANAALQTLDLRFNNIGPVGFASIADGLQKNTGLRELDLSWNTCQVSPCCTPHQHQHIRTLNKAVHVLSESCTLRCPGVAATTFVSEVEPTCRLGEPGH